MDPFLQIVISCLLPLLLIFICYHLKKSSSSTNSGPILAPEAAGAWPIIGHLHLFGDKNLTHKTLGAMADKDGPIFTIKLGSHKVVVVNNGEIAKDCFTTHDMAFSTRPTIVASKLLGYNYAMFGFAPYGAYWREMRKIATVELLSNKRLDLLKHIWSSEVDTWASELYNKLCLEKGSEKNRVLVDMKRWFGHLTGNISVRLIGGKRCFGENNSTKSGFGEEESIRCRKVMRDFSYLFGVFVLADAIPFLGWWDVNGYKKAMKKTASELDVLIAGWLEEHKHKRKLFGKKGNNGNNNSNEEKDFMDVMLNILDGANVDGVDADTINKATCLAWRILMNPKSILAQVLKARYFRLKNILQAEKGSYPSPTWQGILWGRDLLLKGLRRSIGNGKDTRTFRDPWLPRPPSFLPSSAPAYEVARVSDLIESPGCWNFTIIQQHFNPPDAECISSIPLSPFNHEDAWFWHYTNHGNYSVGSGYNTAMTLDKSLPSSASDVFSTWWKQFWGLKIPRKILHFAWRGFHEILPTRIGLEKRKIVSNNSCELCGFGGESNAHAIFWCPFAQEIWKLLEFTFLHEVREVIDFKNVILYAAEVVEKDLFEKIIISAWAIWTERNKITHGQHLGQPQQIVNWIDSYYGTVVSAREGAKVSSLPIQRNRNNSEVLHRDPQEEQRHTILMVDAAVLNNTSSVGLGAIILSEDRRVRAAVCKPLKGSISVLQAETLALLFGLNWALSCGIQIKEVFSDSLSLVTAINKGKVFFNELGVLFEDVIALLSKLPGAVLSHVARNMNSAAHGLAKHALRLDNELSWFEEVPPPIVDCCFINHV